jgi:hypothetical protein
LIRIKPHHFLDIIKLYGRGIEKFVPDQDYHHHFYAVANEIIKNPTNPAVLMPFAPEPKSIYGYRSEERPPAKHHRPIDPFPGIFLKVEREEKDALSGFDQGIYR